MITMKTRKPPIHPGKILHDGYMKERGITIEEMRKALGMSRNQMSCIVNGRKPIRTNLAVKLGEITGTTPDLWLNLQNKFDIRQAQQSLSPTVIKRLKSYHSSFEQRATP